MLWITLLLFNYLFTFIIFKINEKRNHNLYGQHVIRIEEDQIVETVADEILIIKKDEIQKIIYRNKIICILLKRKGFVVRYDRGLFEQGHDFDQMVLELKKFEC